jgi:hypothetical protein
MPTIPNFPENLMTEHMNWHDQTMIGMPGGRQIPPGSPGSGIEFLSFHRQFLSQFHAWYDNQPFADPAAVAPWPQIPPELQALQDPKLPCTSDMAAQQDRIVTNAPPFASNDDLGQYIERTVHGCMHMAAAEVYGEPDLASPATAADSTYFYQLHGLIDAWW